MVTHNKSRRATERQRGTDFSVSKQFKEFEASYRKQMRLGRSLLDDWKRNFNPKSASEYLLESNPVTHFQLYILADVVKQRWVSREWLKHSRFNDDIFDWVEAILKPRFRGVVKVIRDLEDAQQAQWDWLEYTVTALAESVSYPSDIKKNISRMAALFQLSDSEIRILEFALARDLDRDVANFIDLLTDTDKNGLNVVARMMKLPVSEVRRLLSPNNTLKSVIFAFGDDFSLELEPTLKSILSGSRALTENDLLKTVATQTPACVLQKRHFKHLDIGITLNYLSACCKNATTGVNILLYGPPGTGKTQLSRLFAKHCKATLYSVDNEDANSGNGSGSRAQRVRIAQQVLSRKRSTMLCVDECEDVFEKPLFSPSGSSKVELNRMLEESGVPTIWMTNWVDVIEPSLLRRFDVVLQVKPPTKSQKVDLYSKQLKPLNVPREFCESLASLEVVAQGHIETAANVAKALDLHGVEAQECIGNVLEGQLQPLGETLLKQRYVSETKYKPELTNIRDDSLAEVLSAIENAEQGRILLFGPPGTGKTGFAYHLSELTGLTLHHTRASDLLDPYVGGTEQKIARAFAEASKENAILLLDEADSLLTDRGSHQRSWETSQVNELLTQIECFQGILIASTNFENRLDKAMARRFDFKLEFDFLRFEQAKALLKEISGCKALPAKVLNSLRSMQKLTPGDFSVVKRKARLTGKCSLHHCVELLRKEHHYKTNGHTTAIGFVN